RGRGARPARPRSRAAARVISDEEYELFKWDMLADAATEGLQMLYEPLGWARWQFPALPDEERAALAERVLRELLADGLIAFERAGRPMSPAEVDPRRSTSSVRGTRELAVDRLVRASARVPTEQLRA